MEEKKITEVAKKQQLVGMKLFNVSLEVDCSVLSQGFSTIIFELSRRSKGKVGWWSKEWKDEWERIISGHVCKEDEQGWKSKELVIIEGNIEFVKELLGKFNCSKVGKSLVILTPRARIRGRFWTQHIIRWKLLKHSDVGGVTDGMWLLGTNKHQLLDNVQSIIDTMSLQRRLKDIVKHDKVGSILNPQMIPDIERDLQGLLSLGTMRVNEFSILSFYSATGWTKRKLTTFEQLSAYDIQELSAKWLHQQLGETVIDDINGNAPNKIVQVLVEFIISSLGIERKLIEPSNSPNNEKSTISLLIPQPNSENTDMGEESDYMKQYGSAAAKDDNAAIPIALWNGYVFQKHFGNQSFDPHTHGKAFDVLRRGMHRRYCMNLRTSLLQFLREKYGTSWPSLLPSKRNKRKRNQSSNTLRTELLMDLKVAQDAIMRGILSTFWEWSNGSTLFHWRWPIESRLEA